MSQGSGMEEIGKRWSLGNEKVIEGSELVKEGKKMVEQGKTLMEESEKTYKNRFPHTYQRIYENPK